MVTRLESLRVEAALDATAYEAGARRKVAADQAMVESAKAVDAAEQQVGAAVQQTDRRIAESVPAVERLKRSYIEGYKVTQDYEKALSAWKRALDLGRVSQADYEKGVAGVQARYRPLVDVIDAASRGQQKLAQTTGLARHELINLSRQIQDVGVGLFSGQSPLTILVQQGAQIGDVFATTRGTMSGFFSQVIAGARAMITPVTAAIAGVAALGVGIGIVVASAIDISSEARQMGVALRAMGKDAELTTGQIHALVEQMRDLGVGRSAARAAIAGAIRLPGASGADIVRAAGLAPDFAAAYGASVEDATRKLAELGVQGYAAIRKLDEAYGFLTPEQLRQIELLARQGDKAQALDVTFAALADRIGGSAKDSMSAAGQAMHDFGRAVTDVIDRIANSDIVVTTLRAWTAAIKDLSGANVAGKLTSQLDQIDKRMTFLTERIGLGPQGRSGRATIDAMIAERDRLRADRDRVMNALGDLINPGRVRADQLGINPYAGVQVADYGATGATPDQVRQQKIVDDLTAAYQRQNEVMRASVGVRDLVRARLKAEDEARDQGLDGADREAFIEVRVAEAKRQLATAANDNTTAVSLEARGAIAVAAAYAESEAAGKAMEATVRAQADQHRNATVNVIANAQAYRDLAVAQGLIDVTRQATAMRLSADAAEKATAASVHGAEASQEAARQAEVEVLRRTAVATATDATRAAVEAQIATYDAESKRRLDAQQQLERETSLRQANQAAVIAAMQAEAAALTDPDLIRAAEARIERQSKINELVARYGDLSHEAAQAQLAAFDSAQASRAQVRFWTDVKSRAEQVSSDISQFLVDGFVNAEQGGKSAFANLWDGAVAGAKRFVANIAALFLQQKILLPVTMAVVGGSPQLFGIAQPGGTSGGFSLPNIPGIGGYGSLGSEVLYAPGLGFFPSAGTAVSTGGLLGDQVATLGSVGSSSLPAGSVTLGGVLGGVGAGFGAGTLLGSILGRSGTGNTIGSGVGALAGAAIGSIIPGIGTLLGGLIGGAGGGLLGGLFGSSKPSVGPLLASGIQLSSAPLPPGVLADPTTQAVAGRYFTGFGLTDNNGNVNTEAVRQTQAFLDTINAFIDRFGIALKDKAPGAAEVLQGQLMNYLQPKDGSGRQQGIEVWVAGEMRQQGITDLSQASAMLIRQMLVKGVEVGVVEAQPAIITALKNSTAQTMDALVADLDLAKAYGGGTLFAPALTEVEQAAASLQAQLDGLRAAVEHLGLAAEEVTRQAAKAFDRDIRTAILQIEDPLQYALDLQARDAEARLDLAREIGADVNRVERLNALERKRIVEQAANDVIAAEQRIAGSRLTLETQLVSAIGDTALARKLTLDKTDPSLGYLQQAIFDAQDWAATVQAAQAAVTEAENNLTQARQNATDAAVDGTASLEDQVSTLRSLVDQFTRFGKSLRDFRASLQTDQNYSPYGPREQLGISRAEFEDVARRAQLGDADALGKLQDVSSRFLDASRAYNASSEAYYEDFNRVQAVLAAAGDVADRQADIARSQLTAAEAALDQLRAINGGVMSVADATAALATAQQRLNEVMAAKPAALVQIINNLNTYGTTNPNQIYLQQNPDVAAAASTAPWQQYGSTPEQIAASHYLVFGRSEGRENPAPGLTLTRGQQYMQRYPDVLTQYQAGNPMFAGMTLDRAAQYHYDTFGKNEGRTYRLGGWVANGAWDQDSVHAVLAGGEAVIPAPTAAMFRPQVDALLGGRPPANDNREVVAELRALRAEVAALKRVQAAGATETIQAFRQGSMPDREALKESRRQAARPIRATG